jgi:hypothetical protein
MLDLLDANRLVPAKAGLIGIKVAWGDGSKIRFLSDLVF